MNVDDGRIMRSWRSCLFVLSPFNNISVISWPLYISFDEDNILVTFNNISVISWPLYISFDEDNILVTFYNISVISWPLYISFGGGNWSTRRNPPACRKLLTIFIT